ncbi:MAG: glycosyltransferase [Candidatus Zixiibacteriota bacterium]
MKNVLIIAYHFPPARTGGVYRPVKISKYLPDFDWRPTILTVKNYQADVIDAGLLDELPAGTPIYAAYSLELERFENWVFKRIYGKQKPTVPAAPPQPQAAPSPETKSAPRQSTLKRLVLSPLRRFIHNKVNTPDAQVGWIPFAVLKGLRVIRREKIDVILSTSPPESSHVIALILSRLTGKPLVVDFRDPWTTHYNRQNIPALEMYTPYVSKSRLRYERWLERKALTRAGAIIHTGDGRADMVKQAFPMISAAKHHVITNGYDETDFAYAAHSDNGAERRLNLLSVGHIYVDSAINYFLAAMERVLNSPAAKNDVHLTFVSESIDDWRQRLASPPFAGNVEVLGFRPHKETVSRMAQADVLILMLPEGDKVMRDKIIAGRTFEYMRSGRPVMMIGWEGESSRMLEASGLGHFIPFDDTARIEELVLEFLAQKASGGVRAAPNWDYIRQYDRRTQTGRLAGLMNDLAGR